MKKNYTVAMCDILGFKESLKNPLDYVVEELLDYLKHALYWAIHRKAPPNDSISLEELRNDARLDLFWFSDTLLIYTREDKEECLQHLLSTIGCLLSITMHKPGTRLRCGISYGETYIDTKESIYVGNPIVDAHNLEKSQVWSGCVLTPTACKRIPKDWFGNPYVYFLEKYPVPWKALGRRDKLTIQKREMWAIDWTKCFHIPIPYSYIPWSENKCIPTKEEWQKNSDICEKWMNTNRFHIEKCDQCKSDRQKWSEVERKLRIIEKEKVIYLG